MKKNKLLLWLAGILLLSNLLLASFLFFRKPPQAKHAGPRNIIIERLHLDAQQVEAYDVLIAQHRKQIMGQDAKILGLKSQYYAMLNLTHNEAFTDSLSQVISKATVETERINYAHFEDIKKICRPEQMDNFKLLIADLAELFNHKPKKKRQ